MKKSLKIFAVVLMAMLVVFSVSTFSYALGAKEVVSGINANTQVQKQFIPLIIGVTIVFAATSIANLLLGIMGT